MISTLVMDSGDLHKFNNVDELLFVNRASVNAPKVSLYPILIKIFLFSLKPMDSSKINPKELQVIVEAEPKKM